MKPSLRVFLIAFAIAGVVAFLLGLLSSFARSRGGVEMPFGQITMIATIVAGIGAFIAMQMRANRDQRGASAEERRVAESFVAEAGKAAVYVFRDAFYAKLIGFELRLDDVAVGQTRGKTFYRFDLRAGEHLLTAINPLDGSRADLMLALAAGAVRYVVQDVRLGGKGASHTLADCDAASAQRRIRRCRMLIADSGIAPRAS